MSSGHAVGPFDCLLCAPSGHKPDKCTLTDMDCSLLLPEVIKTCAHDRQQVHLTVFSLQLDDMCAHPAAAAEITVCAAK